MRSGNGLDVTHALPPFPLCLSFSTSDFLQVIRGFLSGRWDGYISWERGEAAGEGATSLLERLSEHEIDLVMMSTVQTLVVCARRRTSFVGDFDKRPPSAILVVAGCAVLKVTGPCMSAYLRELCATCPQRSAPRRTLFRLQAAIVRMKPRMKSIDLPRCAGPLRSGRSVRVILSI